MFPSEFPIRVEKRGATLEMAIQPDARGRELSSRKTVSSDDCVSPEKERTRPWRTGGTPPRGTVRRNASGGGKSTPDKENGGNKRVMGKTAISKQRVQGPSIERNDSEEPDSERLAKKWTVECETTELYTFKVVTTN